MSRMGPGRLTQASRYLALAVAWAGTLGSLYFSLGLHWPPCDLCWYQRICLYPLAVIIPIHLLRRDQGFEYYVLPFSVTGAAVALYHYLLQKTDWFAAPVCLSGVSCTTDYLNWFGIVTIPLLAFLAFTFITVMALLSGLDADPEAGVTEDDV